MSFEDNTIHGRLFEPGSVRPIQLGTPRTAGGPASALASFDSVLKAQRLYDSSQPLDAPKIYRALSPDSLFPHDGVRAGPLQNHLYDAGSPVFEPPVHQHQYVEERVPEGKEFSVTLKETRIDPPQVKHTKSNEQAINAQERHIQSMIRHYCGDSEETQVRALELILKHPGKICRIERRQRAGAPSGGVQSLVCLLCPSTSEDQTIHFQKTNAVRTFAEHLTHQHLHIPNPFVCLAAACGKVFPYSQDRDRHEKQIHKMYRPKAYQALLKHRAREQCSMLSARIDNPQSATEFIVYAGPAQVNPHQTATPRVRARSSRRCSSARHRSPKVDSGAMPRWKTQAPNHCVGPYTHGPARSQSSTPHQPQEGNRNVSHSIPFNYGINGKTDECGRPIMTGPKLRIFPTLSPPPCPPFDGMQGSVDEPMIAPGETEIQMLHGHYSVPTMMSQPGSNMVSNPPPIDSTIPSSIGYQGPSTNVYDFTPPLQLGNHAATGLVREQPKEDPTYYGYGSTYSGMQNRMSPFHAHARYQHDNYAIYGSTQLQPSYQGYAGPTMYQAQPQQPLQDGSLYSSFHQNSSIFSSPWPQPQNSTTFTTPRSAQMLGHGAPSYPTYPPSGRSHVTNPDELSSQFYYDFLRTSTPNSGSRYTTHSGADTSQSNRLYANTTNSSQQ